MSPKKSEAFTAWLSQNSAVITVVSNIVFELQLKSQPPMSTSELTEFLLSRFAPIASKLDEDFHDFNSEYSRFDKKDTQSDE